MVCFNCCRFFKIDCDSYDFPTFFCRFITSEVSQLYSVTAAERRAHLFRRYSEWQTDGAPRISIAFAQYTHVYLAVAGTRSRSRSLVERRYGFRFTDGDSKRQFIIYRLATTTASRDFASFYFTSS